MKAKPIEITAREKQQVMKRLSGVLTGREEILFAYAYGSFIEDRPFHDVDIGLYIKPLRDATAGYIAEIILLLEQASGLPMDVRILNSAPAPFLYHVIRGELLQERDETVRVEIVERTIRTYLDIKPFIRKGIEEAFAA